MTCLPQAEEVGEEKVSPKSVRGEDLRERTTQKKF
jgi:hypothetical protein